MGCCPGPCGMMPTESPATISSPAPTALQTHGERHSAHVTGSKTDRKTGTCEQEQRDAGALSVAGCVVLTCSLNTHPAAQHNAAATQVIDSCLPVLEQTDTATANDAHSDVCPRSSASEGTSTSSGRPSPPSSSNSMSTPGGSESE